MFKRSCCAHDWKLYLRNWSINSEIYRYSVEVKKKLLIYFNLYKIKQTHQSLKKYDMFHNIITFILDIHAPLKKVRIKQHRPYWMTSEYINLTLELQKLKKQATTSKSTQDWDIFKKFRNKITHLKTQLKAKQIKNMYDSSSSSSKTCWKLLNDETGRKKKNENTIPDLKINGVVITDKRSKLNLMCKSFIESTTSTIQNIAKHQFHSQLKQDIQMDSIQCSVKEIQSALKQQSAAKPMGYDNIPALFLKNHESILSPILTDVFNSLIEEGEMPTLLKKTLILPLYKGRGCKSDITSYRPISILSSVAKIMESAVYQKLMTFFDSTDKLNDQQHGYRHKRSTLSAVLLLTEAIRLASDKKQFTVVCFIDFSSAFLCIIHSILLKKLAELGICGSLHKWMTSYLTGRYIIAKNENVTSDEHLLTQGAGQGSSLSGLLFSIYLNDLPEILKNSHSTLYCDDAAIYAHGATISEAAEKCQSDLHLLQNWADQNGMKINTQTYYQ